MWKIGQKLVCIRFRYINPLVMLTVGEIYTFDGLDPDHDGFIFLEEVTVIAPPDRAFPGERESFRQEAFRPIDETFGEETAERLEKEFINQPEPQLL